MPFDGNEGAFIVPKTEVGKRLYAGLNRLGPNGERWAQGSANRWKTGPDGEPVVTHCMIGALWAAGSLATGKTVGDIPRDLASERAWTTLCKAVVAVAGEGVPIPSYNDATGRTFPEIRAIFLEAIRLAEAGNG